MENKQTEIIKLIENLESKTFGFYFFTLDTKGNPVASIANIYEHVKVLTKLGYKAYILHEKNEYHGVGDWLGVEYAKLPHISIEQQNLNLTTSDFIIIPEIFANVMEQVKTFPCKKIVFSQSYHYILELLGVGKKWGADYGFNDVITTSEEQAEYVKELFPRVKTKVVPVSIPEYFKTTDKIKKPIISIVTREQNDALRIVKAFYLQNPIFKWVTFRELRGLPKEQFAKTLGESCLAVWVDDVSGFGTFPIEAIECDTPVIGKIPNIVPEWMKVEDGGDSSEIVLKDNGIWTNNVLSIPSLISKFMQTWVEDSVSEVLIKGMEDSKGQYTVDKQEQIIKDVYESYVLERRAELESVLEKEEKEV